MVPYKFLPPPSADTYLYQRKRGLDAGSGLLFLHKLRVKCGGGTQADYFLINANPFE